jgi:hypothetical protein
MQGLALCTRSNKFALSRNVFPRQSVVQMPVGTTGIPVFQNVQTGSEPTQPHFQWCPSSFAGVNWLGREINRSSPSSAVVENKWIYTSTPPHMPSWRGQVQLYLVLVSLNPLGQCLPNVFARGPLSASKNNR